VKPYHEIHTKLMMTDDIPPNVAGYYDLSPVGPADLRFYTGLIPSPDAAVLELGCGTGRVLLPLSRHCGYIHGVDSSEAMLAICRAKLRQARLSPSEAKVTLSDVTDFRLDRTFDLVIAPYRLVQTLETDMQLDGLFQCIRAHLSPSGTCVVNVARPEGGAEELQRKWSTDDERFVWKVPFDDGYVTCHERRSDLAIEPLVLYPELIWRRYEDAVVVDEARLRVPMRHHDSDGFTALVEKHGFRIVNKWGGFSNEEYGVGPELIVEFQRADA
jgi:SAM-dependent methyltransferase